MYKLYPNRYTQNQNSCDIHNDLKKLIDIKEFGNRYLWMGVIFPKIDRLKIDHNLVKH